MSPSVKPLPAPDFTGARGTGSAQNHLQSVTQGNEADEAAQDEVRLQLLLNKGGVPPELVLQFLRRLKPMGPGNDAGLIDGLIAKDLTGVLLWRAQNIRRYGPESHWPPELRMDTKQIIDKARVAVAHGDNPERVADLLRPLNATARHPCLTLWRTTLPQKKPHYYDLILKALAGPSFEPVDDNLAMPPMLALESKSESEL